MFVRTGQLAQFHVLKRPKTSRAQNLTIGQVTEIANASAYATPARMPLNAWMTIRWMLASGFSDDLWAAMQTELLDRLTRFLRHRGIEAAFTWTRERVKAKGPHTHVCIYIGQKPVEIKPAILAFLYRRFGFTDELGSRGVDLDIAQFGLWTEKMRCGPRLYSLKGINHRDFRITAAGEMENLGDVLGINHEGTQGTVKIKRAGVSQNLGRAARFKAGWRDVRGADDVARVLNPLAVAA